MTTLLYSSIHVPPTGLPHPYHLRLRESSHLYPSHVDLPFPIASLQSMSTAHHPSTPPIPTHHVASPQLFSSTSPITSFPLAPHRLLPSTPIFPFPTDFSSHLESRRARPTPTPRVSSIPPTSSPTGLSSSRHPRHLKSLRHFDFSRPFDPNPAHLRPLDSPHSNPVQTD